MKYLYLPIIAAFLLISACGNKTAPADQSSALEDAAIQAATERMVQLYGENAQPSTKTTFINDSLCILYISCTRPDGVMHQDELVYFDNKTEKPRTYLNSDMLIDRDSEAMFSIVQFANDAYHSGSIIVSRDEFIINMCMSTLEMAEENVQEQEHQEE